MSAATRPVAPALRKVHGPVLSKPRAWEQWKVRWCAQCGQHEFDAGPVRGWVPLHGTDPRRRT